MKSAEHPLPLHITIPPRGRALLCVWAALPGLFAAPFLFWRNPGWGVSFCLFWALLVGLAGLRATTLVAELGPQAFTVRAGVAFPVRRVLPREKITGAMVFRSPLCRLAGASVVVLFAPGVWVILPGLPARQAELLCGALLAPPEVEP